MQTESGISNVVLIGFFDLSIFDKYFFIKHNLIDEGEILPGSVFNAIGGVQLLSKDFNIIISFNQIVISSTRQQPNPRIYQTCTLLIQAANLSNINALGINFYLFLSNEAESLESLSKRLFYNENNKLLATYFTGSDSLFGVYASVNIKSARLKLDVKPSKAQIINTLTQRDLITFIFNYHFDIKPSGNNSELISYIEDYDFYMKESEKIISIYT